MKTIFLVVADYEPEGFDVVRAFSSKPSADSFADTCNEYRKSQPRRPHSPTKEEWEEFCTSKLSPWTDGHPAPEHIDALRFEVQERPWDSEGGL